MNCNLDIAEIERAAFVHFMAGFDGLPFALSEVWPGAPGKAYCFEMLRRTYGMAGAEYAMTLRIFTQH
jgi:hypothetical protein